jgi:hypothetical protein
VLLQVKSNEYEVVFCTEPLDELCMMELKEIRYICIRVLLTCC